MTFVVKYPDRGHIDNDKPKSPYTSCWVQTSYVKHHFYTRFIRGVFVEWFWTFLGHTYLDQIWMIKRRHLSAAEMADFFSANFPRPD